MTADPELLIGCSHGTDDPRGRAAVRRLLEAIREIRPRLEVREAFVDVQDPNIDAAVSRIAAGRPAVIVPLLLSAGYHVHVDIAGAAAARENVVAAEALGPDPRLAALMADSLAAEGIGGADEVVLVAAGSSDARALDDVHATATLLDAELRARFGGRRGGTAVAYAAGGDRSVRDVVAHLRGGGRRIAIASYLLAPGFFASLSAKAGADVVTPPLLSSGDAGASTRTVANIALERFDAALPAQTGGLYA